jgi:hypothetical protein
MDKLTFKSCVPPDVPVRDLPRADPPRAFDVVIDPPAIAIEAERTRN